MGYGSPGSDPIGGDMRLRLFRPYSARLSDWFAVAHDRSTWWAFEFGLSHDLAVMDACMPGRLVGRAWPEASAGALYLASDLAAWCTLFRDHVTDPAFPPDAIAAWSARLVDAFAAGEAAADDRFAGALVNLHRRWGAVCDGSRLPAAAVELARYLDAVRLEASWASDPGAVDLPTAIEVRARGSALPLLLTCTPANLAPGLGLRDTAATRALIRRAAVVAAWSADLVQGDADGYATVPSLVARLAHDAALGWDEAVAAAVARHDAEALALVSAVDAAIESADEDVAWLARTLSDFVAAWLDWAEDRSEPERLPWLPNPFVVDLDDALAG